MPESKSGALPTWRHPNTTWCASSPWRQHCSSQAEAGSEALIRQRPPWTAPTKKWLGWQDSNLRMPESKSGALPTWRHPNGTQPPASTASACCNLSKAVQPACGRNTAALSCRAGTPPAARQPSIWKGRYSARATRPCQFTSAGLKETLMISPAEAWANRSASP